MDFRQKLEILADAAKYDASCASSGSKRKNAGGIGNVEGMGICHSYAPDGRCISLLKILLTNYCIYDCSYCVNRVSSEVKRAKFTPEEVVWLTLEFYKRNYIEGLFLSSGIIRSPDQTMLEMVEVARSLRLDHKFGGYIHLKAVAGCSRELLEKAGLYADRLSANVEMPTQVDLDSFAPAKKLSLIETSMEQIHHKILESKEEREKTKRAPIFAPGGQSTQMIVGASPSSDRVILSTATHLYESHSLKRVYYSAFSPIPDSDPKLPLQSPPLIREHRLYQADWLMRFYGFKASELVDSENENLDLKIDPKLAWALKHREFFPLDINRASKSALLRVPGFGTKTVDKVLKVRKFRKISLEDLGRMHIPLNRAKFFIITAGATPLKSDAAAIDHLDLRAKVVNADAEQLSLFQTKKSTVTGEL